MTTFTPRDDGDDNKGDDNKASANPHDIDNLGDDIGTRIGQGKDDDVEHSL